MGGGVPGRRLRLRHPNTSTASGGQLNVDYVAVYNKAPASGGSGISTTAWYNVVNQGSNLCVNDGGTGDGSVVSQVTCGSGNNQQWQFQTTDSGYYKVVNRAATAEAWDVTGGAGSTGDSVKIQTWSYGGGTNQQWQPVSLGNGYYKLVARNSGKCLDVPGASTASGLQLQQYTCNSSAAQAWKLVQKA